MSELETEALALRRSYSERYRSLDCAHITLDELNEKANAARTLLFYLRNTDDLNEAIHGGETIDLSNRKFFKVSAKSTEWQNTLEGLAQVISHKAHALESGPLQTAQREHDATLWAAAEHYREHKDEYIELALADAATAGYEIYFDGALHPIG